VNCICGNESTDGGLCAGCREFAAEERLKRRQLRIDRSGLPSDLRRLSMLSSSPAANEAARQWASGQARGLCLTGPVGVGKTYLAAAAAWKRLQDFSVRWVSVARLMTQLRAGFGSEMKAQADRIVAGNGAIVLDDLDKANPTEYGKEVLFAAIDGRVEEGAPLLVTTNLPLSKLGDKLGAPIASRLAGYCVTVRMQGEDRRLA
jgi:DNA replication protein DnaC